MRKREMARFKQKLLEDRKRIMAELKEIASNISAANDEAENSSSYSNHMADLGTDAMEREKNFLYASQDRIQLERIEVALRRIDDANYGVCEACGKNIPLKRLEAVPDATLCVSCQEQLEKSQS